ncbi:MAG TPA: DEAD/DEAH box helicase family protein [Planctomycetaceae bacterium]|nr:DEAD/DEAH box helicase family protein [Planctomycetaceae bacterium]
MTSTSLTFAAGTLLLDGGGIPRPKAAELLGTPAPAWDARVGGWRADAIAYRGIQARLHTSAPHVTDAVPAWQRVRWPNVRLPELRDEQRAAVDAWMCSRHGCIVMPTGTGKTEVALSIMARTSTATLVVAPVRDLMYQWHRRILRGLGYDAGVIGDSTFRVRPVSVTTYDSACIHMPQLGNRFELIVFDECHHLPGDVRRDAARMSAAPLRLGLTATPDRSDRRDADLDWLIGPRVYELPLAAVRGGTLADYDVVRIPVFLTDAEQARYDRLSVEVRQYVAERRKDDPQFTWQDLCADTGRTPEARRVLRAYHAKKSIEERAGEKLRVLEDLFRLHAGQAFLIFAGSNAMARDVSRRFLIPCLLSHCGKRERLEVLEGLEAGRYPALVANRVLDEGVDLPAVKVAVVIGGTASTRQSRQRLGRVLRKSGDQRAVLYEVVCMGTNEEQRSRERRKTEAYAGTRHRRARIY